MRTLKLHLSLLPVLALGALTLTACQEEAPEPVEESVEEQVGPIEEEVATETTGYYNTWDTDTDARLTSTEFDTGLGTGTWWSGWDTDADTHRSQDEFNAAYSNETWYDADAYGEWDADDDGLFDM